MILLYILTALVFMVYSSFEGIREAYYFYAKIYIPKESSLAKINEHAMFSIQRGIFILVCSALNYFLISHLTYWSLLTSFFSLSLMFPFWHDGFYYMYRNNINPETYPKRFFDNTTTSNALQNYNFTNRTIMFIVGLAVYILYFYE